MDKIILYASDPKAVRIIISIVYLVVLVAGYFLAKYLILPELEIIIQENSFGDNITAIINAIAILFSFIVAIALYVYSIKMTLGTNTLFYLDLKNKSIGILNSKRDVDYKLDNICYFFYNKSYDTEFKILLNDGKAAYYLGYDAEKFLDKLLEYTGIEVIIVNSTEDENLHILYNWSNDHEELCTRHNQHKTEK